MKLFGFNIDKVKNEAPAEKGADVFHGYVPMKQNIYRIAGDMANYKYAVLSAENYQFPSRYSLYQIYVNSVLDAHWSAAFEQRKNLTLRKEFCILSKDGEENEEASMALDKKWFYEFLKLSLDSIAWGHSLIQLGDWDKTNKEFLNVELIPRQYVNPPLHIVMQSQNTQTGLDYTLPEYKDWVIEVGDRWDLGILLKAAPLLLWKKNALGAWAEYQEGFGVPVRIGKTNVKDAVTMTNMVNMLSNWGVGKYGVFAKDDQIELVESDKNDAHNVFNAMIDRINSEISKLVLGQTSTLDEKSFTGSAEVHERVLDTYEEADEHFIMNLLNYSLKPILVKRGIMREDEKIGYKEEEGMDASEKIKVDAELMKYFDVDPNYIEETYGTKVTPKQTDITSVKNELDKYYGA